MDFVTSNLYLDTYFSALHNSVNDKNLNSQTEDAAREYYRYYYDLGMFGDPQLNWVFMHSYFASMLHDMYTKLQNYQDRAYSDKNIANVKAALYFGEHKTAATILKMLGEDHDYAPKYVEEIYFELYDRDSQPYVHATHNGEPMELEGITSDGHVMFNVFMDYICDKIYYGDVDQVKDGDENFKDDKHQQAFNPICVELLYNEPFKNNEYFFTDIDGIDVEHVLNYDRPYLARDVKDGTWISDGEKYLLKSHTEEIPTISGEISFDSIIPFTVDQQKDQRINWDTVDPNIWVIDGKSDLVVEDETTVDSGYSDVIQGDDVVFDHTVLHNAGDKTATIINSKEHLMST